MKKIMQMALAVALAFAAIAGAPAGPGRTRLWPWPSPRVWRRLCRGRCRQVIGLGVLSAYSRARTGLLLGSGAVRVVGPALLPQPLRRLGLPRRPYHCWRPTYCD